jgi:hypothetical protein
VREHFFDGLEIRDDSVSHGPDRSDVRGSAPEHVACRGANGFDPAVLGVEGDHRGFAQRDHASRVDARVRCPEVDSDVGGGREHPHVRAP